MGMSDKPLFQNSDEQEERYAPERVPGSGPAEPAASAAENPNSSEDSADTGLIPGAIAPVGGATTPSTGSVFAPVAGGAGLDDMLHNEDTAADRDSVKE
jgi:hypothetical protein